MVYLQYYACVYVRITYQRSYFISTREYYIK